jgi:hypothetical protein
MCKRRIPGAGGPRESVSQFPFPDFTGGSVLAYSSSFIEFSVGKKEVAPGSLSPSEDFQVQVEGVIKKTDSGYISRR